MRKCPEFFFVSLFLCSFLPSHVSKAQAGWWTWISGSNIPGATAVYGTQGVPSVLNHPAGQYEQIPWKDKQGNFWLYGGMYPTLDDMWKYNPITNEWTWMRGTGTQSAPVYGTMGVSDPANYPGFREFGSGSWTDTSGNFWLFGNSNNKNDLWKYDISTNEWTWVNGSNSINQIGSHGVLGVPGVLVQPGGRSEAYANWVDTNNNLWLFGGIGYDDTGGFGILNDLMKYDIVTNEWTWIKGSDLIGVLPFFGTLGISNPLNDPGARITTAVWKDHQENFWLFGGADQSYVRNDMWKYDPLINEWVWMSGSQTLNDSGNYTSTCIFSPDNLPVSRMECRASVCDNYGNFWMFGGGSNQGRHNDLWVFNPVLLEWNWMSGSNLPMQPGNWGTMGVAAPGNVPNARVSGVAWWGNDNKFYMFGGLDLTSSGYADLWVYSPDTNCINVLQAAFTAANEICPGSCTNFINQSVLANSYQWIFSGGTPATSTDVNPQNICYATPGNYDVTLIASDGLISDTVTLPNFITVLPFPPSQSIIQSGDTLFANAGSAFYQWYLNGNLISGATDYFHIATVSGDYYIVATDTNGCEVEAAIYNVVAEIQSVVSTLQLLIFPSPVEKKLFIRMDSLKIEKADFTIYNLPGEKIYTGRIDNPMIIDCTQLLPGFYMLEVVTSENKFRTTFVKE